MINIVLFGPPGAGKGTQAALLKDKYKYVHISTGDVFRYHISEKTPLGVLAKSYIDKGHLVPDEVTVDLLKSEFEKFPQAKGFIFDGFPRTIFQAEALDRFLKEKDTQINAMISLEVAEDILVNRILERGKTSGRTDDISEEKIRDRFTEYYQKTEPLKEYYSSKNKYHAVQGIGSLEEVTERLSNVIDQL